jgi:hypothetical protein
MKLTRPKPISCLFTDEEKGMFPEKSILVFLLKFPQEPNEINFQRWQANHIKIRYTLLLNI